MTKQKKIDDQRKTIIYSFRLTPKEAEQLKIIASKYVENGHVRTWIKEAVFNYKPKS